MPKFNPDQLSTIEEARELIEKLKPFNIATGVAPEAPTLKADDSLDYHNDVSGIYLTPWATTPDTPEPTDGEARFFFLRYNKTPTGFQPAGFNVGLVRKGFKSVDEGGNNYPLSYVAEQHRKEVEAQIADAGEQK